MQRICLIYIYINLVYFNEACLCEVLSLYTCTCLCLEYYVFTFVLKLAVTFNLI